MEYMKLMIIIMILVVDVRWAGGSGRQLPDEPRGMAGRRFVMSATLRTVCVFFQVNKINNRRLRLC